MCTTVQPDGNVVKTADDNFDTARIVATVNRLLGELPASEGPTTVTKLTVLGHEAGAPSRIRIVAEVLYEQSNCILAIPAEVDAGALRGLEVGIAAD
jgi:hypothetical protein